MTEKVKATHMDHVGSYGVPTHVEPLDGKVRIYFSNGKYPNDYVDIYIDNQGELTVMTSYGRLLVIPQAANMIKVRPE